MVNEQNHKVSVKLLGKSHRNARAVERLQEENYRLKGRILRLEQELCDTEAKRWEGAGNVLLFHQGMDADSVRKMADAVMQKCKGRCAVFSENPDGAINMLWGKRAEISGSL